MKLSVGICTYKRPTSLTRSLKHIAAAFEQVACEKLLIVVDNDGQDASVGNIVRSLEADTDLSVRYVVEPRPGISAARNAILKTAYESETDLLVMIDDDEWPSKDWLKSLMAACDRDGAHVVGGPVRPVFPEEKQELFRYAKYWSVDRQWLHGRPFVFCTCNFLLDLRQVDTSKNPGFDEEFGLSGGGDTAFFRKLFFNGHPMSWASDAIVYEEVPATRASLDWLRQRRYRVGNHAVRWEEVGMSRTRTILKTIALMIRLPVYPLTGRDGATWRLGWLLEFDKVRGRIAAHMGRVFVEYARTSAKKVADC